MILNNIIWSFMTIFTGFIVFILLKGRINKNLNIAVSIICALLIYVQPLPLLFLTWKYPLPKKTIITFIFNFGLPYNVGKDSVTWNNIAGFDKTWVLDERIKHNHPMDHIDFVYSTLKIPGIKPEHVCIIAQATGSIFIDMLKEEATARCHYLVKNAVSLGFVQDVVAGTGCRTLYWRIYRLSLSIVTPSRIFFVDSYYVTSPTKYRLDKSIFPSEILCSLHVGRNSRILLKVQIYVFFSLPLGDAQLFSKTKCTLAVNYPKIYGLCASPYRPIYIC